MYNLKKGKGTYKGLIGECMFKLTRKYPVNTKFFNKDKYLKIFGDKFSKQERDFINKNWFSIDAIGFDYSKNPRKAVLFEIKTMNKLLSPRSNWLPKMTLATHNLYKEAFNVGFDVKVAAVLLCDDWDYEVEIKNFDEVQYYTDKPKKYDKR